MAVSSPSRLDDAVAEALATPDLAERTRREPAYAAALIEAARETALAAFDDGDEDALDAAHRALYALYAQGAWSPLSAPRDNQHDLTLAAVLLELERGFEGWLASFALPEARRRTPRASRPG